MQKIYLLGFLLIGSLTIFAQKNVPANPQKDKQEYEGYTINIIPAKGSTYLFDIMQGPIQLTRGMQNNPATMLPKGFDSKDDAYKVAKWMIKQYEKDRHLPGMVPPHVLDELKIN